MTQAEHPQTVEGRPHVYFENGRESRIDLTALADDPCPVRSSITDRGCLLPAGHAAYRPDRFHRYLRDVAR